MQSSLYQGFRLWCDAVPNLLRRPPQDPLDAVETKMAAVTVALVPDDLAEKLMTVSSLRVRCQGGNVTCRR